MYVKGMYPWGNIHTWNMIGMYVCLPKHTYLENYRYVCMSGCVSGDTYIPKIIGMYVCLGKHTYLETRGMYVCQRYVYLGKHTYLENDRYVCMSGETYIPRN